LSASTTGAAINNNDGVGRAGETSPSGWRTTTTTTLRGGAAPQMRVMIYEDDGDNGETAAASSTASDDTSMTANAPDTASSGWAPEMVPEFAVDSWDHFWFLIF
jgi:hypothetical protein